MHDFWCWQNQTRHSIFPLTQKYTADNGTVEGIYWKRFTFIFAVVLLFLLQHPAYNQLLKVHKHEIIANFFLPKSNHYIPFVNFRKKFRFFSFNFRQNFDVRTFPLWLSIRGTKYFLIEKQIFFSSKSSLWFY